jgi:hypothetical protein
MQTAAQPHSKTHRRGPAPVSHAIGIEVTDQDILDAIAQIEAQQNTCYVMIAKLSVALGLTVDDRDWLIGTLKVLDTEGSIALSPVEQPQQLALYQACWYVRNASGIPCHEVALINTPRPSSRIAPLLRRQAPELPVLAAKDESTDNPMMQKRRISDLVKGAADVLFKCGGTPHARFRVLHVEQDQPSTERAA